MIQIIGVKRILILIILLSANAALAAATYMYVKPEATKLEQQLRSTRSQIAQKRTETDRLRNEFAEIQENKAAFENLQASGFISDQNRLVARRRIMDIQQYTKVLRAGYNINSASIVNSKTTDEFNYAILSTPITINIEAVDDVDFYSFLYWMESAFPGHTAVSKIRLERVAELNETSIRAISSGSPITLIRGSMEVLWRTIVPKDQVQDSFATEGF